MDRFHEMVIEDEIVMCGSVLILGIIAGIAARVVLCLKSSSGTNVATSDLGSTGSGSKSESAE